MIGVSQKRNCSSLDYKPYRSSGLTIYAEDLTRGLVELGHTVTVVAARRPNTPAHSTVDAVEIFRVPIDRLDWISYSWWATGLLRQLLESRAFDVVHFLDVHFAYAYHGPFVASVWQSFRQRLTAHEGGPCHTGALDRLRREAYYRVAERAMERPSVARAARLVASCHSTRNEFVQHYRVSPSRIDVAVQGIDTSFFQPTPAEPLRRRLNLEGCRVLLSVGFMTPRKGLEYLAQAMSHLSADVHWLIVGRWAPGYRSVVLKALGTAAARVHEVGYVADAELPQFYSLADVYVAPSLLEGLGITPIEAAACGTPAVVTSASSGPEEVGDAGLIVAPGDPAALGDAIRRLLADEAGRRELGRRAQARARREFSYRSMAEATLQTYRHFLDKPAGEANR